MVMARKTEICTPRADGSESVQTNPTLKKKPTIDTISTATRFATSGGHPKPAKKIRIKNWPRPAVTAVTPRNLAARRRDAGTVERRSTQRV